MQILVIAIHVIVCFALILIVLLQTGKGADIGAAFGGGSSQTIFGSSGAGNFLTKATTVAAIVFMCTSLALAYFSGAKGQRSVMREAPVREEAPATPAPAQNAPVLPPAGSATGGQLPKVPAPAAGVPVSTAPVKLPVTAANNAAAPVVPVAPQGVKVEATSTAKVAAPAAKGTAKPVKVTVPAAAPVSAPPAAAPAEAPAPQPVNENAGGKTEAPAETK